MSAPFIRPCKYTQYLQNLAKVTTVVFANYPKKEEKGKKGGEEGDEYSIEKIMTMKSKNGGYEYHTIDNKIIYIHPTDAKIKIELKVDGTVTLYRYEFESKEAYDTYEAYEATAAAAACAVERSGGAASSLEKYTVKVLKEEAKKKSIPRYSTMKKSELIRALRR